MLPHKYSYGPADDAAIANGTLTLDEWYQMQNLTVQLAQFAGDVNMPYLISMGALVFLMNAGFAFLEAGVERTQNLTNLLMRVIMDSLMSAIAWWICGFAFAFGGPNRFIGQVYFAGNSFDDAGFISTAALWFYGWTFAAASSTIISGALTSRVTFPAYIGWNFFMTAWVYPIGVHWIWSSYGWLSNFSQGAGTGFNYFGVGVCDFAGGLVVHACGGATAFWGCLIIGPRFNRFSPNWEGPKSLSLQSLFFSMGLFFLWIGWYGFNAGSVTTFTGKARIIGLIVQNTTLTAAAAALMALIITRFLRDNWDIKSVINGTLAGLVASTSGAPFIPNWAAFLVGLTSAPLYYLFSWIILKIKLDDSLDAFAIHYVCGVWSCVTVALFAQSEEMKIVYGPYSGEYYGLFVGGGGYLLGINMLGIAVVTAWSSLWSIIYFLILKRLGWLRASLSAEVAGMDVQHMQLTNIQRSIMKDLN